MRSLNNALITLGLFAGFAQASSFTFTTAGTLMGSPEDASATLTTNDNGTLDITLNNLESNPTSVIQNISDFFFTISAIPTSFSLSSSSGTELTVNSDQTYTVGSSASTGWVLSSPSSGSFELTVLGAAGPEHTIIGGSSNGTYSGGTYSNAAGSIAGNTPHNPFLESGTTFALALPGVTSATTVSAATFSFGTTAGNDLTGTGGGGVQSTTPEPLSLLLTGSGLLLIGLLGRRVRGKA